MMIVDKFKINKVAAYKCMNKLLFHTRYFFKIRQRRKFVVGEHHEIICDALERVLRGECSRLIINIAPRYGKTEVAVKNFISHGLSLNPAAKFIHLSYSDSLALDNSEEIRDFVQEQEYMDLFPNVRIKPNTNAKKKWYTDLDGGVYATSAAGQVTGFGAGRVDIEEDELERMKRRAQEEEDRELLLQVEELEAAILTANTNNISKKQKFGGAIIIDDPIKPDDADSDVIRERVNNRFDSTIRNRVNSRNTPIIIIMQRLHPMDLSGYLMEIEPDKWEVISLPCIRPDGTALWPFKHTLKELYELEAINEVVFGRQYQQDPKPKEGLLFPDDELQYYNPETVDVHKLAEYKFCFIDPADEGGDDLSALFGYLIGNKIYIDHIIYNSHGTDINEPNCADEIVIRKVHDVEIEGNSAWTLFAKAVRKAVESRHPDCQIRIIKNSTNKHTRILAAASFIRNNFVFRSDYAQIPEYRRFMKNLTSYNKKQEGIAKNKHDDAPDSCAGMAKYFQNHFDLW